MVYNKTGDLPIPAPKPDAGMLDEDYTSEYSYNANGSMTMDLNKGITNISYDNAGNLRKITFSGDREIRYVYASDGTRLRTVHSYKKGNALITDSTDYAGNLVIRNGKPYMYMFPGGYYSFDGGRLDGCHYYIKDYLGSNRMVVGENGKTEQVTHYYPYGGIIGGIDSSPDAQPYKYEGKEFDRTFGLDWYDIHARQYDPVIPSWHAVDPMCEKYYGLTPYTFCGNNPVNKMDINGKDSYYTINGDYAFTNTAETDNIYIISKYQSLGSDGKFTYYIVWGRQKLHETEEFLSPKAYSKIFTNVLERHGIIALDYPLYGNDIAVSVSEVSGNRLINPKEYGRPDNSAKQDAQVLNFLRKTKMATIHISMKIIVKIEIKK